ncbi:hypothetical protein BDF14DRAFT_1838716 [Spinellus fusiger]|nr:hypothetical protein BDF14DRAFT_1838716 [Spinellus fusiger]
MWSEKPGSSRHTTLQHDELLAESSHYSSSTQGQKPVFRTTTTSVRHHDMGLPWTVKDTTPVYSLLEKGSILQPQLLHDSQPMMDGGEVQALLNSSHFSDAVYSDDLYAESTTYTSYHHSLDHEHSLAEKMLSQQQKTLENLLSAEDIVAYLQDTRYTNDIHGLPPNVQSLIKEAREEVQQDHESSHKPRHAVHRLEMIRAHLMKSAQGNTKVAAQNALKENEWDHYFMDKI